jgi:SAM-dependent methyltransferase
MARFRRLGPWVHAVRVGSELLVDSESTSPFADRAHMSRCPDFGDRFPGVASVLELGALEGSDTVMLARAAEHVTAIEARSENLRKAEFVCELAGVDNVTFLERDLETFDIRELGNFDAVYCSGILYHLRYPWQLLEQMAAVTPRALVWTHYWQRTDDVVDEAGRRVKRVPENFPEPLLRGTAPYALWFRRDGLFEELRRVGFDDLDVLAEDVDGEAPWITLTARRTDRSGTQRARG